MSDRSTPPFQGIAFLLSSLGYAVSRQFAATLAPFGLEPRQFGVLRAIGFTEGRSQQALGEQLQIPPSRMVAIIDELESRGLVERRANPTDRRARALHPTEAGRQLLDETFEHAAAYERRLTEELSAAERQQLAGLLRRLAGGLGLTPGAHAALRSQSDE